MIRKILLVIITVLILKLLTGCAQNPDEIVIPTLEDEVNKQEQKLDLPVPFTPGDETTAPAGCVEARKNGADC